MSKLYRYYHTLKYVKLEQIVFRLYYAIRSVCRSKVGYQDDILKKGSQMTPLFFAPFIDKFLSVEDRNNFTFINVSQKFENIDWDYRANGMLWNYNLNYFDYLNQKDFSTDLGKELIDDFIANARSNYSSYDPYPTALRLINWVKFISKNKIENQQWTDSINAQCAILLNKLEFHILGNHLLEDGFGLLFGGAFLSSDKILKRAIKIIKRELDEEILQDGGHFELSPMYHCIILDRLLDSINLVKNNADLFESSFLDYLNTKAQKMLSWLQSFQVDNQYPHFNDSAYGIAPAPLSIIDYGIRLGLSTGLAKFSDSGYRKFHNSKYILISDVGNIGPDYIPGHAHADTFNFVLYSENKPFIVDTGTSTYEWNDTRSSERSSKSHNTLTLDLKNHSEVWGAFRVSKRAKVDLIADTANKVVAQHNGYKSDNIIHERSFEISEECIVIEDKLSNLYNGSSEIHFHFHPDVSIISIDNDRVKTDYGMLYFEGDLEIHLESFNFAESFNRTKESKKIRVVFKGQSITTKIA